MYRVVLFLILIALAAAGAAWVAEQPGDVALSWGVWRAEMSLPVFALALSVVVLVAVLAWTIVRTIWRAPLQIRRARHERRRERGRQAITQGLLAIGHGDSTAARGHASIAKRHAEDDPLTLLLHAQSAQLDGDSANAQRVFRAMAERPDTRLLGLRGLFIEAQRSNDLPAAATIAEEALRTSPKTPWASQAVLGFRCARSDWSGALSILDKNLTTGLIDRSTYRRQRGVLLTARALELETSARDRSRESIMEAVKLAPTLIPTAVLAARFHSEAHQIRRAMRTIETAWLAQPHPDLADAYAHVRLGDAARQRLVRVETLAMKSPGHIEGALAVARAAIDATEFARARQALAPFLENPTQRVAVLMAEIERTEHGDSGRARAWTLRAVRAAHDPVWTADGYVSDRWRPVSPLSGRLDAFQWQTPLAPLPSDKGPTLDWSELESPAPPMQPPRAVTAEPVSMPAPVAVGEPSSDPSTSDTATAPSDPKPADPKPSDLAVPSAAIALPVAVPASPTGVRSSPPVSIAPVIPIVRAPDDPGVDDDGDLPNHVDEEPARDSQGQATGWRGFLSRMGG